MSKKYRIKNIIQKKISDIEHDRYVPSISKFRKKFEEYINDILTVPVNIAGLPAISIPFGKAKCNRPIGLQLIAKEFQEHKLLNSAFFLEQALL